MKQTQRVVEEVHNSQTEENNDNESFTSSPSNLKADISSENTNTDNECDHDACAQTENPSQPNHQSDKIED